MEVRLQYPDFEFCEQILIRYFWWIAIKTWQKEEPSRRSLIYGFGIILWWVNFRGLFYRILQGWPSATASRNVENRGRKWNTERLFNWGNLDCASFNKLIGKVRLDGHWCFRFDLQRMNTYLLHVFWRTIEVYCGLQSISTQLIIVNSVTPSFYFKWLLWPQDN